MIKQTDIKYILQLQHVSSQSGLLVVLLNK